MPDADMDQVVRDLSGAAFGSAGERCMALPVVVPVGEGTAERLIDKLLPEIESLRLGISSDPDAHYGPVVTGEHKARVEGWIAKCEEGKILVDGRGFTLQGHEKGFCRADADRSCDARHGKLSERDLRPCAADRACGRFRSGARAAQQAPIWQWRGDLTRNGHAAREFAARVNVGMVGINVPIPVPVAYHTLADGNAAPLAIPISMAWKASSSGPKSRRSPPNGLTVRSTAAMPLLFQRWPDL
jgi:malonate-semialdehyde dehydrogenase (acetylating)/methylmalonate-semialdehyde dehydrogenase